MSLLLLNTARQRSLTSLARRYSSQTSSPRNIRNIGIIAHIDAGKTTATERFLYLAGETRTIGDVDSGNTVTDYLDIERERGITVQSAAVSFKWNGTDINLIDTPGHVDFTLEVERCTRVLDGVVTILDSKAGVQAQTRTVWRQASKFGLPSVFFINKMDKSGSSFENVVDSMEQKLSVKGLVTVYPLYKDGELIGFLDVLKGKILKMSDSQWSPIQENVKDEFLRRREELCYALADVDSQFMTKFLDEHGGEASKIEGEDITKVLRQVTLNKTAAVVSCGSALRCAPSVLPVLDQIVDFLPSAEPAASIASGAFGNDFSGLVFKIHHDKRKGQMSYMRMYTGTLKSGAVVFNANRGHQEGPLHIFAPYGDELMPVKSVKAGEIAVVSGLKDTVTGDTLIASEASISPTYQPTEGSHLCRDGKYITFSGIEVPDPVYFCCIEPPSISVIHQFEKALAEIAIEDPSIRVRQDRDSGQTIVETMGELHLEIIKDKFIREYGLRVFIGPLQIAYREVVQRKVEHSATVSDEQGESGRSHKATLTMEVEPKAGCGLFKRVALDLPHGAPPIRHEWQKAISEGCANALHNGPILGFPVQDIQITLKSLQVSGGRINSAVLSACAHKCVTEALELGGAQLMEPVMRVEVTLEDGGEGTQGLLQELSKRRAHIDRCDADRIHAVMPLAEMEGLASVVRILTSGLGSLHVQVDKYVVVSEHDEAAIVAKLRS